MNLRTNAYLGLLGCLTVGCFNPDDATQSTDTDTDGDASTVGSTASTTATSTTASTTTDSTTASGSVSTTASTDEPTSTTDETTSTTDDSTSSTDDTGSSSDESSTGETPAQCDDGVVVQGEVCFESFHELSGQSFRFGYLEDIDGDDDADLVYSATSGEIVVQFNGNGVFGLETMSTFNGVSTLDAMGFTDFNGDDVLDGILVSAGGGLLYAVEGNTSGAYSIEDTRSTESYAIAMGEMDGAAGDEFVVMVLAGIEVFTVANDGAMAQASSTAISDFNPSTDVQLADLNGDDQLDVVYLGPYDGDDAEVRAQLGSGDGTLSGVELSPLLETDAAQDLVTGDFDGDDNVDLAVADGPVVRVAFGNGALGFAQINVAVSSGDASRLAVADVDQDGWDDLVVGYSNRDVLTIFRGLDTQDFDDGVDIDIPHSTVTLSTGDINGDGVPDIVVTNVAAAALTVVQSTN